MLVGDPGHFDGTLMVRHHAANKSSLEVLGRHAQANASGASRLAEFSKPDVAS